MKNEALKLALEALKKIHNHPKSFWNCLDEIAACEQALEQPEPEPIGEIVKAFSDLYAVSIPIMPPVGTKLYASPPKREPHYDKTEMNAFVQNLYDQKMREGKHGHYETMFHVVHRAIEAAHGIGEKK